MKFTVPEMTCGHCTAAIEKAVAEADTAAKVDCNLESKLVTIDSALSAEALKAVLLDAGYEATPA